MSSRLHDCAPGTRPNEWLRNRPLASALLLELLAAAVVLVGALVLTIAAPGLPGYSVIAPSQSLVLVLLLAVGLLVALAASRRWAFAGFTAPGRWRRLRLYWLPVLLLAAPFVAGAHLPAPPALGILALGYFATALWEEGMWRGLVLGLLRPLGIWPAVLISSALFGLGHLTNSALRGASVLILLQAFGAAVGAVGYAALRLRTDTIWPLIAIHAAHDFALQLGNLPIPLIEAPIDTVLLVYAIVLLRRPRADTATSRVPAGHAVTP